MLSDLFQDQVNCRDRTLTLCGLKLHWPFPIACSMGSSEATVFGYRYYHHRRSRFLTAAHTFFYALYKAKWWLRHRIVPRHIHHIVKTELPPGYHDPCEVILYAAFKSLRGYVEKCHDGADKLEEWAKELQDPDKQSEHGGTIAQGQKEQEAVDLYRWWTMERPADHKECDRLLDVCYGHRDTLGSAEEDAAYRRMAQKIDDDEQAMLHRLINIRPSLWS